jgi:hypothetical protein
MLSGRRPKGNISAFLDVDDPGQPRADRSWVAESISVEVEVWSMKEFRACRRVLNISLIFTRAVATYQLMPISPITAIIGNIWSIAKEGKNEDW